MNDPTYVFVPGAGGVASYWAPVRERLQSRGASSVAVDLPGPDPEAGLPEYVELIVQAAEGRDPDGPFDVDTYFLHDVSPEALGSLLDDPRDESDAVFASPWGLDAWPDVPTRVMAGQHDRLFPVEFQRGLARERLGLEATIVPGGHLAALSCPDALVDALLRT